MKRLADFVPLCIGLLVSASCSGTSPAVKTPASTTAVPAVSEPVTISRVPPYYPEKARKAGIQGQVTLEAIITNSGNVEAVRILKGADPLLDNAAMRAVQQWFYRPALQDGKPVPVMLTVTATFSIQEAWPNRESVTCDSTFNAATGAFVPEPPSTDSQYLTLSEEALAAAKCASLTHPISVSSPQPDFPPSFHERNLTGVVVLEGVITVDGTIAFPRVLKSPYLGLAAHSLAFFKQYRYQPATCSGRPVPHFVTVTHTYSLR